MRKSVAFAATVGILAAAIAAVFGLWLPARHRHQDAAYLAAGERALAQVALPSPYTTNVSDGRIGVCSNGTEERCFLGPGDPSAQVPTLKRLLASLTTGPVTSSCTPVSQPSAPDTCQLVVPVAGSRLAVDVFAHPADRSKPLAQWTYSGAYVLLHLDAR
jgi:hypothetical protein